MDLTGLHATVVPGSPARRTRIALWAGDDAPPTAGPGEVELVELVRPTGSTLVAEAVAARVVSVADLIDDLVRPLPVGATGSMVALATVAKAALGLVARGHLQPAIDDDDLDQWHLGPFDERDRAVRAHLVATLPPAAHCLVVGQGPPVRMLAADAAVVAFYQAVADVLPRTAAAPLVLGANEWAGAEPRDVSRLRTVLVESTEAERTLVGLRVLLPDDDESPFTLELRIRSAVDLDRTASAAELWAGEVPWAGPPQELDLLRSLRRAAAVWPPLRRLLDEAAPTSMELSDEEAMDLFGRTSVDLGAAGVEVSVPTALTRTLEATAHVEPPPGVGDTPGAFDRSTICQLTWRPTLDGEPVSDAELAALAANRRPLVRVDDEWVVVDPKVMAKLHRRSQVSASEALAAALGGSLIVDGDETTVTVSGVVADLADRLRGAHRTELDADPVGLHASLRPYQRRGVAWIEDMSDLGFGGVLADDMGLGKTIQVISVLLRDQADSEGGSSSPLAPTLVVCPASVVTNWCREVERFAPSLTVRAYTGVERTLDGLRPGEVVVTTYGLLRRDLDDLTAVPWGRVVADEAQHVKNPSSSTAKALRRVGGVSRLALTGTPVENRLTELWALLDWTTPGLLGDVDTFRRTISIPIERDHDADVMARFGRMVAPFLLRRRKDDPEIAPELPPKTETVHTVALTAEQAGLYRATADSILDEIAGADGIARRGLVLKLLTALKQICNHPAHYLGESGPLAGRSGKLDAFDELVTSISEAGDSTLVFTQYVVMGELLVERLAELGIEARFLSGSVPLARRTAMVDDFQAGAFPVFVISLKAGGTGLNLTRATHVIHYDRWWNPAVENQASDRAWRIGQDRPVQVHQLLSDGTLEERIAEVLASKQSLADAVVGGGEAWISELGDDELSALVELGRSWSAGAGA